MTIADILAQNVSQRVSEPPVDDAEIERAETTYAIRFPASYLEFLAQGGLGDLRFTNRVIRPHEIQNLSDTFLPIGLTPFAANGTGDFFCWESRQLPDENVVFWDHETAGRHARRSAPATFLACLTAWRF